MFCPSNFVLAHTICLKDLFCKVVFTLLVVTNHSAINKTSFCNSLTSVYTCFNNAVARGLGSVLL